MKTLSKDQNTQCGLALEILRRTCIEICGWILCFCETFMYVIFLKFCFNYFWSLWAWTDEVPPNVELFKMTFICVGYWINFHFHRLGICCCWNVSTWTNSEPLLHLPAVESQLYMVLALAAWISPPLCMLMSIFLIFRQQLCSFSLPETEGQRSLGQWSSKQ